MTSPLPGPASREERVEQAYARAEQKLDVYYAKRRRRGPEILIGTCVALALAVGTVAAVDLRRLQTPRGAALAWTGAAVFGDCTAYSRLSVEDPQSRVADRRSDTTLCGDLREKTEEARGNAARTGIDVVRIEQAGREATVEVEVRRPDGTRRVDLPLVRKGDGWAVVRTPEVCRVVGCA